jgi:hypothetical protein
MGSPIRGPDVHRPTRPTLALSLALTAVLAAPAALAQDGAAPAAAPAADSAGLVDAANRFVHAILIAKPEQASAAANALLADGVSPEQLAAAIDGADLGKRLEEAFRRGRKMGDVADAVAGVETKLETGRKALAREASRIEEAVKMLAGPIRGQMMAKDRLLAAGEYAVPALLRQVVEGRDPALESASVRVLVEMRRQSALPLMAALPKLDPGAQRKVCVILGQLGYPIAIPALLDVAQRKGIAADVFEAANTAAVALGSNGGSAASAYVAGAKAFLQRDISLCAFPEDSTQNAWKWTEFGGLSADRISTGIYFDAMAMLFARRALELDPTNSAALATFIAADLRREAASGEGVRDPLFGDQGHQAQFYATAAGPRTMQDVLRIGLDLGDSGLVRASLLALRSTASAGAMIVDGASPVIAALSYPDRRVQFEAAITLASVQPTAVFPGSDQVVPLLAQAVRAGGQTFAGILCQGSEDAQRFADVLKTNGFVPLTAATDAAGFGVVSARNAGADMVVISGTVSQIREHFSGVRAMRAGGTLPVLVVAQPADKPSLESLEKDRRTVVLSTDVSDDAFKAGIDQLISLAYGARLSSEDMSRYVGDSLDALTRIGYAGGTVYPIGDAERGLAEALRSQEGPVRLAVARVLAMVGTESAQRAVIEAALSASGDEQAMLLGPVAEGARRFGPKASQQQCDALRTLVEGATGSVAVPAATAYGALNLPASGAVRMIIKSSEPGKKPDGGDASSEKAGSSASASN